MGKKLKDCTKGELLYIIKRLTHLDDFHLHRILNDMEYEDIKKKLAKAEEWGRRADECRGKYLEILKAHEGKRVIDIPIDELEKVNQLIKDAERADRKYDKLMKEVDAYGNS